MIFCISVQIQIHIPNAIFVHCAGGGLLLLGRQMQFDPDGRLFSGARTGISTASVQAASIESMPGSQINSFSS